MVTDAITAAEELPEGMPGRPCWIELATRDPADSAEFYTALFDWDYRVGEDGYRVALADGVPVAGLYLPQGEQPDQWTLYLAVHQIDNTAERVLALGGEILSAPKHVPGWGYLLVAADPSGGPTGFWRQDRGWNLGVGFPGAFTWAELTTWDGDAADAFYTALFDFTVTQVGDGDTYDYTTWTVNGEEVLGRLEMGPEFSSSRLPFWNVFFEVDPDAGVDRLAARAVSLGGKVVAAPFDSPYGRTAILRDPHGAEFSVLDRTRQTEVVPSEHIGAPVDDIDD